MMIGRVLWIMLLMEEETKRCSVDRWKGIDGLRPSSCEEKAKEVEHPRGGDLYDPFSK